MGRAKKGSATTAKPAKRRPPPQRGPMTVMKIHTAIQCYREGWKPEDISAALEVTLSDVRIWLAIFNETARTVTAITHTTIPEGFQPIERIRQIACNELVPASVQLAALRTLLQENEQRALIDWTAVKIEDIPDFARAHLAGLLADAVVTGEVDPEFKGAGAAERELFMVVGVLVEDAAVAQELLDRHRREVDALRQEAMRRRARRRLTAPTVRMAAEYRRGREVIEVEAEDEDAGGS